MILWPFDAKAAGLSTFRKHEAEIRKVFADASPKELRALETTLKKIGKRAESLGPESIHGV
jgi:hypothetical protein